MAPGIALSNDTKCAHALRDPDEAGNVCTKYIIACRSVFFCCLRASIVDIVHDTSQAQFSLFERPAVTRGSLLHFQRRSRDAAKA